MTSEQIDFDRSVLGVEVELGRFPVTREAIAAFCNAVGETNPLYLDEAAAAAGPHGGIIAPPAFYLTTFRGARGLDPKVNYGNTTFNAGQHCEFYTPVHPGDEVVGTIAVREVYEKTGRTGRMVFVVRRTTLKNQDSELVATIDSSTVHRSVERG